MAEITDDMMRQGSASAKPYAIIILKKEPNYAQDVANGRKIIWEHGRRNYALRAEGVLSIVCPIIDDGAYDSYHPKKRRPGWRRAIWWR